MPRPLAAALLGLPLLTAATEPPAQARLRALSTREAELSARIGANRAVLVRLLSALQSLRRDPPPALLVRPDRARDAARAAILLGAVTPELQRRARRLAGEAAELRAVRREAAEASAALFAADSADAERRGGPARLRTGDLVAPPMAEDTVLGAPPARLQAPLAGSPTGRFGQAVEGGERLRGWRWTALAGAPVAAPVDGVVEHAGEIRGRGLVVVVRTAGGWRTVVTGLRRVVAPAGVSVHGGERLGDAAGGELLLELRRGVEPVDPAPFMATR